MPTTQDLTLAEAIFLLRNLLRGEVPRDDEPTFPIYEASGNEVGTYDGGETSDGTQYGFSFSGLSFNGLSSLLIIGTGSGSGSVLDGNFGDGPIGSTIWVKQNSP